MRPILLLGPGNSTHTLEWRRILSEVSGTCVLASLHPCDPHDVAGGDVVRLPTGLLPFPLAPRPLVRTVRQLIRTRDIGIIIAYYLTSYGLLASWAVPGRYVAAAAGSDLFPVRLKAVRRWAAARAVRAAAGGAAWTGIMSRRMVELGMPPERIHVAPRGIDLTLFRPRAVRAAAEPLRVISTRRLRPLFRHHILIDALARLASRNEPLEAVLIGDGSERDRLEQLIAARGLQGTVRLPGPRPRSELAGNLARADVFVSLSRSDGLSASLLEAMACGLLPIVSDIPSNRTVVSHEENGLLVAGDDPAELAAALRRAGRDENLRARARARNLAVARRSFDIRRNTSALLDRIGRWSGRGPAAGSTGEARGSSS
ncbi:MAG: glycosyltransferase [Acidobacteriota bacterium]